MVHVTDVLAVAMMLGITAQVKEAGVAWDKGEKKSKERTLHGARARPWGVGVLPWPRADPGARPGAAAREAFGARSGARPAGDPPVPSRPGGAALLPEPDRRHPAGRGLVAAHRRPLHQQARPQGLRALVGPGPCGPGGSGPRDGRCDPGDVVLGRRGRRGVPPAWGLGRRNPPCRPPAPQVLGCWGPRRRCRGGVPRGAAGPGEGGARAPHADARPPRSLHKVLFTEQPETYYKWDNWPPESDRK